jgi:hypothetical protein
VGWWSHQAICTFRKELWLGGCLGVEPRRGGIALAWQPLRLSGESFWLKASMIGVGGPCPFWIISWHFPYNWGKARKTLLRVANLRPTPLRFIYARRQMVLGSLFPVSCARARPGTLSDVPAHPSPFSAHITSCVAFSCWCSTICKWSWRCQWHSSWFFFHCVLWWCMSSAHCAVYYSL